MGQLSELGSEFVGHDEFILLDSMAVEGRLCRRWRWTFWLVWIWWSRVVLRWSRWGSGVRVQPVRLEWCWADFAGQASIVLDNEAPSWTRAMVGACFCFWRVRVWLVADLTSSMVELNSLGGFRTVVVGDGMPWLLLMWWLLSLARQWPWTEVSRCLVGDGKWFVVAYWWFLHLEDGRESLGKLWELPKFFKFSFRLLLFFF